MGKPLIVRSAYRSPEHNRAVGGAAFDIAMAIHDPTAFEAAAREVGFPGFGFYPRSGFIHVDLGPARQWAETQTAILPLVPYLYTLCRVFIVVALGGIAAIIYARLDDWRLGRR